MKKTFYDEIEEQEFEVDIPEELYRRAYEERDCDALYEIGVILETETEISMYAVADIMEDAYNEGRGSADAGDWLADYRCDDGRYDAWS